VVGEKVKTKKIERELFSMTPDKLKPVKLAIIGGGSVTSVYYLPAARQCPLVEIVAVVDPSPRALKELKASGFAGSLVEKNGQDFLSDSNLITALGVEGVVVASPNYLHETTVCQALGQGLWVLCEKPLTLTELGCRNIGRAAERAGKDVSVGMVRRLLSSVAIARNLLERGAIGELKEVVAEDGFPYGWSSDSGAFFDPRSGGVLADMGVHYLDILESLLGDLVPVEYQDDSRGGVEADSLYHLKSAKGIPIRLQLSRLRKLGNRILLRGSSANLILKKNNFEEVFLEYEGQDALVGSVANPDPRPNIEQGDLTPYFIQQFKNFSRSVRSQEPPFASVEQATKTIRLIEWAYQNRKSQLKGESTSRPQLPASSVTITGATGFIGTHLVERMFDLGCKVSAPVRSYRTCASISRFPVELPRVDLLNYDSVLKSTQSSRFIFHLAYGAGSSDDSNITIQGTKNLVEAAIANQVECIVVLSTMFVFGREENRTLDENSPYDPTGGEYGVSKSKMEKWCLERAKTAGKTRVVILNPSFVYGPRGKTFSQLPVSLARANAFCWVDGGMGSANYVYVDNLVDAMLLAASCEKAHGQRFLINDGTCSWKEFLSPILGSLNSRVPSLSVAEVVRRECNSAPSLKQLVLALLGSREFRNFVKRLPLLVPIARFVIKVLPRKEKIPQVASRMEVVDPLSAVTPPSWMTDLFSSVRRDVSTEKATRVLGWKPKVSLVDGQKTTLEWLEWNGDFRE